jgi:hypothetical protein
MRRHEIPGGSYCEAWPDGRYIALLSDSVESQAFGLVAIPPSVETLLYMRGDMGESFAGVNHADHVWEYTGGAWFDRGLACGVNAVIYDHAGTLHINPVGCPHGSQGFRFVENDRIYTGDETYNGKAINGLAEWTRQGDVQIGQSYVAGDAATFFYQWKRRILELGHCWPIRMNCDGNNIAVAMWKMKENKSVFYWLTVDEIAGLPLEAVPPPPPPPPPEDKVPDWAPFFDFLSLRWGGSTKNPEALHRIVGEWHHQQGHTGFGLLHKPGGQNHNGFSEDWILEKLPDGRVFGMDVIGGMGGPNPTVNRGTPTPEPNPQNWREPPKPSGPVPTPVPVPVPTPTPTPQPPAVDLKPLYDKIDDLKAMLDEETRRRIADEKKLQALSDDFDQLITLLKQPRSTGRIYSHSHGFHIIPPGNTTWD